MRLNSFTILFLLIVILTAGSYFANNFNFLFEKSKTAENAINRHLSVSPQFGVYSTVWTAHAKRFNDLIHLADSTEINTIIIDVKDSDTYLGDYIKNLVEELHKKNIYAIARIVVFQDSSQIKNHPGWYFKKPARQQPEPQAMAGGEDGSLWQDIRGWYWMDPENREVWDYNVGIAKKAIDAGFDELNFDYIRFPAFAKNEDVIFPPEGKVIVKNLVINNFARYLTSELKKYDPGITLSVDLFAYNMLRKDDLGIGQNFVEIYDYFDYVSPMIYPSHYLSGNFGFENPAEHPYEVILGTLEKGKTQLWEKSAAEVGTTTPAIVKSVFEKRLKKLRPWLQDFNIGAVYDGEMIRKEKQAIYDAGLTSGWLLWNPRNVYTEGALDKNDQK